MARVVVFHHVQGLTTGIDAFADLLRRAGHVVDTPDLFDGRVFESIEAGLAHVDHVGFAKVLERALQAGEAIGGEAVYIGFSLGVLPAQKLAQTQPDSLGAVLCHSCVPASEFGDAWPSGVPVQIHGMDNDPFFVGEGDVDAARAIVESAASAELFLYPGDAHLFADSSLPSYDRDAADLMGERIIEFLDVL